MARMPLTASPSTNTLLAVSALAGAAFAPLLSAAADASPADAPWKRPLQTHSQPKAYQAPYTVVRDHNRWRIHADGTFEQWVTVELRPDSQEGAQSVGEREIGFNQSLEEMRVLEAYTVLADGTRIDVAPDKIRLKDDREDDSIYSDMRNWVVIFPQSQVGSRLIYSYYARQHTPEFAGQFANSEYITPHVNWASYRLEVQVDPGIEMGHWTRGIAGGEIPPQSGDAPGTRRFRFEFSQVAQHAPEPSAVALAQGGPGVAFSSFASYAQVAQAYQARAQAQAAPTDAIRALSAQLTRGLATERDKVRAIYEWIIQNIRYVGVYTGVGGVVPHPAQSVLDNRYGDCKDKAVLFEALLAAAGIASSPALVHSDNLHVLPALPTPFAFDHVITYIPSLDLFLDATAEFVPMGFVPARLLGQPALIASTGEVKTIPRKDLTRNYTESRVQMQLRPDGSVGGRSQMFMHGSYEAYSRREQARNRMRPMERVVNEWLSRFLEAGDGELQHSDPRNLGEPWRLESRFELEPVVNMPGPSALSLPVGLSLGFIKEEAQTPAFLQRARPRSCASHRHLEQVTLELPPGQTVTRIPGAVSFAVGPYRYTARYERTDAGIRAFRELVIDHPQRYCLPETELRWREMALVIKRDLRSQLFVE